MVCGNESFVVVNIIYYDTDNTLKYVVWEQELRSSNYYITDNTLKYVVGVWERELCCSILDKKSYGVIRTNLG